MTRAKDKKSLNTFVQEQDTARFEENQTLARTARTLRNVLTEREKELDDARTRLAAYEHPSLLKVEALLGKRQTLTREEIAKGLKTDLDTVDKLLIEMSERGYNVSEGVVSKQGGGSRTRINHFYGSDVRFGIVSDAHLGNRHEMREQLHEAYDVFKQEGIEQVYCPGNLLDGEKTYRGQEYEIYVMGADNVVANLAAIWPKVPGITTYHVASSTCHEGYYLKSNGLLIGKLIQSERPDMVYLGLDEADVVIHEGERRPILRIVHPGGGTSYADSYKPQKIVECVPLDSEILTREGWKTYDALEIGEDVLAFNPTTNRCEWTPLRKLNRGRADVLQYENQQFKVRCTAEHKWVVNVEHGRQVRYDDLQLCSLREAGWRNRVVQSAPAEDGPGLGVWEYSDFLDKSKAVERVLSMTAGERRAFIEALLLGEGTIANSPSNPIGTRVFAQNPGLVCDAFRLACQLEGIATTEHDTPAGSYKPDGPPSRRVNLLKRSYRGAGGFTETQLGEMDVWCPTTDYGTWVMRQERTITITGNSYSGADKPAILAIGHFHKGGYYDIRDVLTLQAGCLETQTPFMRKLALRAVLGFWIVEAKLTDDGSIRRFKPEFFKYYLDANGKVLRDF